MGARVFEKIGSGLLDGRHRASLRFIEVWLVSCTFTGARKHNQPFSAHQDFLSKNIQPHTHTQSPNQLRSRDTR